MESNGVVSWLAKETRADICGRVALLQQCFPEPQVKHLVALSRILKEARDFKDIGIWIQSIPPSQLHVAVTGDAAWGNAMDHETMKELCSQGGMIVMFVHNKLLLKSLRN